jgi:tetratricopeptide (TPR) repeat protein
MSDAATQTRPDGLEYALQLQQAGNIEQAVAECRRLLACYPESANALYLLGCLLCEQRKAGEAAECLHKAAQIAPQSAEIQAALGDLYAACGRPDIAIEHYRLAVELRPNLAAVHYNLGNAYGALERYSAAVVSYKRALTLAPDFMAAYYNLGNLLHVRGEVEEAILCFERAVELAPDFVGAREQCEAARAALQQEQMQRAQTHYQAGLAFQMQGRLSEAEQQYRQALELNPHHSETHNNLGAVLWKGRRDAGGAALCHELACRYDPHNVEARINLGIMLYTLSRHEEAREAFMQAHAEPAGSLIARKTLATFLHVYGDYQAREAELRHILAAYPDEVSVYKDLSESLAFQGRVADAEAVAHEMLERFPDSPESHAAMALLLLYAGDYEQGWREYAWMPQDGSAASPFPFPLWAGASLEGKRILVYLRAGFGDTIQMARYLPLLKSGGAWVALECRPELASLMRVCDGVDAVVERDLDTVVSTPVPAVDYQILLNHLPARFGTRLDTIPPAAPCFHLPASAEEKWRRRLAEWDGFKVGIVWSCSDGSPRTSPLAPFAILASVPGVTLFSLQKGHGESNFADYLAAGGPADRLVDLAPEIGDFVDTAAAIRQLDLVITVDTSVAHLAGALESQVWTLLPYAPDWRWMRDRADSPWYPTMRLFRQPSAGDWNSVLAEARAALAALLHSGSGE